MEIIPCAVVQAASVAFDPDATIDKVELLTSEAARGGAKLVVFPEAFVPGYPSALDWGGALTAIRNPLAADEFARYEAGAIDIPGPHVERLRQIAKDEAVYMVIGVIERVLGSLYCAVLFFDDQGRLFGTRRKIMPTMAERLYWAQGDGSTLQVHETPLGRIGAIICWENYMPLLRAQFYQQGIQLYCAPTMDDSPTWRSTVQHIALEGRCFVLSACQYSTRADFPTDYPGLPSEAPGTVISAGGSCIVDPLGDFLVEPARDGPAILYAELDRRTLAKGKFYCDVAGHYSRDDVLGK